MFRRSMYLLFALTLPAVWISAQESVGVVEAKSVYKKITVDGDIAEWQGVPAACVDKTGDGGAHYDFGAAYLANDKENLYIRLTFAEPQPFGSFYWYMNIAFDTDLDPTTGHRWLTNFGSEFIIQGRQIFDQRCGDWACTVDPQSADNNWGTFAYAEAAPLGEGNVSDVEFSIRRDLVYKNMEDGQPNLSNPDESPLFDPAWDGFTIMFETEDENYQSVEWLPDPDPNTNDIGAIYFFAQPPVDVPFWELY
jgi:hypothetical protein